MGSLCALTTGYSSQRALVVRYSLLLLALMNSSCSLQLVVAGRTQKNIRSSLLGKEERMCIRLEYYDVAAIRATS